MKIASAKKGAGRYVVGKVEGFDQKNEMFCRPLWDPAMSQLGKKFYMTEVPPRDKPGFRLTDQALVNAGWHLENTYAQGVAGGRMGMYAWEWDRIFEYPLVPPGLKIDPADPIGATRNLKKAASFFGAALSGVCKLDRRWVYSSAYPLRERKSLPNALPAEYQYAVALAIEMDYTAIQCSPAGPSSAATGLGYSKMAFIAGLLAHYIRGLGYKAIACGNDTACSIPIAIDAGLGEIARNGLLITPAPCLLTTCLVHVAGNYRVGYRWILAMALTVSCRGESLVYLEIAPVQFPSFDDCRRDDSDRCRTNSRTRGRWRNNYCP